MSPFLSWHGDCLGNHMKAAFTNWKNRIAPVFDVAREVVLVEADQDRKIGSTLVKLPEGALPRKVQQLREYDVMLLVCGAISRTALELVKAENIEVFSFVAGNTDHVIDAWLQGCLEQKDFAMPGCINRRQRRCRYRGRNE